MDVSTPAFLIGIVTHRSCIFRLHVKERHLVGSDSRLCVTDICRAAMSTVDRLRSDDSTPAFAMRPMRGYIISDRNLVRHTHISNRLSLSFILVSAINRHFRFIVIDQFGPYTNTTTCTSSYQCCHRDYVMVQ